MRAKFLPFVLGVLFGALVGLLFERYEAVARERERCEARETLRIERETAEIATRKAQGEAAEISDASRRAVAGAANEVLHLREELRVAERACSKPQRRSRH